MSRVRPRTLAESDWAMASAASAVMRSASSASAPAVTVMASPTRSAMARSPSSTAKPMRRTAAATPGTSSGRRHLEDHRAVAGVGLAVLLVKPADRLDRHGQGVERDAVGEPGQREPRVVHPVLGLLRDDGEAHLHRDLQADQVEPGRQAAQVPGRGDGLVVDLEQPARGEHRDGLAGRRVDELPARGEVGGHEPGVDAHHRDLDGEARWASSSARPRGRGSRRWAPAARGAARRPPRRGARAAVPPPRRRGRRRPAPRPARPRRGPPRRAARRPGT